MNDVDVFVTKSGAKYIFDGTTSFISPISEELFDLVNSKDNLNRDLIAEIAGNHLKFAMDRWPLFQIPPKIDLNIPFIKKNIEEYPYPQLILGVTDDCNLRCKYCIYSGKYFDMRTHRSKTMSLATALESVNYYIDLQEKFKKRAPEKESVISFYGGEPLLSFDLIKAIVSHVKQRNFKTVFALTTNGTLLTESVAEYLVSNNFLVSISLDGPEVEHDRNRVYKDGCGSYKKVMENIQMLLDEINKQGKSEVLPILILTCYDEKTDMLKLNKFFENNKLLRPFPGRVTKVVPFDGVDRHNPSVPLLYKQYVYELENNLANKGIHFKYRLFGTSFNVILSRNMVPYGNTVAQNLGSICIPGQKIFVDTDGIFHICEKVNYNFPIGNSKEGLNYPNILKILQKWATRILEYCSGCAYKSICGICFANCMDGDMFNIGKLCMNERSKFMNHQLSTTYSLLEHGSETMQHFIANRSLVNEKFLKLTRFIESC